MKIGMVALILGIVVLLIYNSLFPGWGSRIFETEKIKQEKTKHDTNEDF